MRHLLILLSILLLSSPQFGQSQETNVLYRWKTSSGFQWKTFGNGEVKTKYVGEISNGKPNGTGTLTYSDGKKYMGEWKNGEPNGLGIFSSPDGGKYEGEWENGEMEGQGIFTQIIMVHLLLTRMVTTSKPFVIERKMHNKAFNRIVKPLRALSTG